MSLDDRAGMLRAFTALLPLLAASPAFSQPADAPIREPAPLSLQHFAQQEAALEQRAWNARALKTLGVGSFVLGGVTATGFALGSLSNIGKDIANSISASLGGGPGAALPDYTPLLGAAIAGVSIGLVCVILGVANASSVEAERDQLGLQRTAAIAHADGQGRRRWIELTAPPTPPAEASLAPSPPPSPPEPSRKPLRPVQAECP